MGGNEILKDAAPRVNRSAPWYADSTNSTVAPMESTSATIPVTVEIKGQITMTMLPMTTSWEVVREETSGGCSFGTLTISCVRNAHNHDGVGARKFMY
jgi:hypothetical protein